MIGAKGKWKSRCPNWSLKLSSLYSSCSLRYHQWQIIGGKAWTTLPIYQGLHWQGIEVEDGSTLLSYQSLEAARGWKPHYTLSFTQIHMCKFLQAHTHTCTHIIFIEPCGKIKTICSEYIYSYIENLSFLKEYSLPDSRESVICKLLPTVRLWVLWCSPWVDPLTHLTLSCPEWTVQSGCQGS